MIIQCFSQIFFPNFTHPVRYFPVPPRIRIPQVEYHCSFIFSNRLNKYGFRTVVYPLIR